MLRNKAGTIALATLALTAAALSTATSAVADPTWPLNGCPTLTQGTTSTCVGYLQYELDTYYGFSLNQDKQFGPNTESAVVAFQAKAGIGVDGIVGPQTQAALYNDSQPITNNCQAVRQLTPNWNNGGLSNFGVSMDLFIMDPVDYSGTCTGWIQRSENGGGWTRITSIHTAPSNGGDATTYTYWDGVGAKAQVCVDDNGSVVCSAPF
jgi:hypothetical protein